MSTRMNSELRYELHQLASKRTKLLPVVQLGPFIDVIAKALAEKRV